MCIYNIQLAIVINNFDCYRARCCAEFGPNLNLTRDRCGTNIYISDNYLWPIGQRSKLNLFDRLEDSNGSQWISENSLAILTCFSVEMLQLDLGDMNCLYIFINVFNQSFF